MIGAKFIFAAVVVAYPLIVYFGLNNFDVRIVALVLIGMAVLRLVLVKKIDGLASAMPQTNLVIIALLCVGVLTLASNLPVLLQYYPVIMNILMFVLFFTSLFRPPTVIERIARIGTPDLPATGIAYTRKVTIVWCGFFVLNGGMALYTVLGTSLGFWAVYNSLVSYSLMGLLLAGEYLVRRRVKRTIAHHAGSAGWN